MTPLLEARSVSRWFHAGTAAEVRAVDGVSLSVPRGACVLLTGPSGSGKTTLLALLGTLETPTAGAALVDGIDPAGAGDAARAALRRRIGFAFQGGPLVPGLALWENVTLGRVARGEGVAARRERAAALLGDLGLLERLRAPAEELSTGEAQRAVLARALAGEPEILLLDEPLAHLDPASAALVAGAVAAFHGKGGTVVAATHDTGGLPAATEVCRLERGRRA